VSEVEWIRIDLQDLYRLGHIDVVASELLKKILETYNLEYVMLVNCSPDVGCEYFVDDDEFKKAFDEAWSWLEEAAVVGEYAKRREAKAVVLLYDGYEWAYALVL